MDPCRVNLSCFNALLVRNPNMNSNNELCVLGYVVQHVLTEGIPENPPE